MNEGMCTTFDIDTATQRVTNLSTSNLSAAMCEHKARTTDIVNNAVLHQEQRVTVFGKGCTVTDNTIVAGMYVALGEFVIFGIGIEMYPTPTIGSIIIRQIWKHAVGTVASQGNGLS